MLNQLYLLVSLFRYSIILSANFKGCPLQNIPILNIALFLNKQKVIYILDCFNNLTNVNHNATAIFPLIVYCCYGGLHTPSEAADG
jgi:hypothetical protein